MTEDIRDKLAGLLKEECGRPANWWYLSFATEERFLGALILRAAGIAHATVRAWQLGLNPGGEILGFMMEPGEEPAATFRGRLLTRADLAQAFDGVVDVSKHPEIIVKANEV